jgi:uncharacterized protein YsxB (DUF464 family)
MWIYSNLAIITLIAINLVLVISEKFDNKTNDKGKGHSIEVSFKLIQLNKANNTVIIVKFFRINFEMSLKSITLYL